jgi:transposase
MQDTHHPHHLKTAAHDYDTALYLALELSRSDWLIAVNVPGSDKLSKYKIAAADTVALRSLLARLRGQSERHCGAPVKTVCIHEAGLDGFWVDRLLQADGVESHVVDAASIAVDRRSRRAKTDRIDVEKLLRTLMGWARGERRICSMVRPPSPEQEDERRLTRERGTLITERVRHVNRIKGLLATQGVFDFDVIRQNRRKLFEDLRCWDRQPLPPRLKTELLRELDRLELVISQIAEIEAERNQALEVKQSVAPAETANGEAVVVPASTSDAGALLLQLRGIGPEFASVLSLEAFYRKFANRREVAAYAGLVPSPWKSGSIDVEQGISKAGNSRLRKTMIQLAWLWLRHQPGSALSRWFHERVGEKRGKIRRITVVAVARKLLVALWRFVTQGLVPDGAELKGLRAGTSV